MQNSTYKSKYRLIFLAILYLPGTFLHELSHYLMAKLLFVPVGHFSLKPKFVDNGFELGSVAIGKTDIFRRFLIGIAPFITGTILLVVIFYHFFFTHLVGWQYAILFYFLITILNTLWLSKRDLEGAWKVILILGIALLLFIVLH